MANISIDLFGTLSKYPEFWQKTLEYVITEGHKVFVITGPWEKEAYRILQKLGYIRNLHFTGVISIIQFLWEKGFPVRFSEDTDSWVTDDEAWWLSKAEICDCINSKIHFDNNFRFHRAFDAVPTRFVNTRTPKGMKIITDWAEKLKVANTYDDDWGDYDDWFGIGGVVPIG